MAKVQLSFKRIEIDKATRTILVVLALTAVLTVTALAGSRALFTQLSYQNRVISAKKTAKTGLEANLQAVNQLQASYLAFENTPESAIGTNEKNSKVVLDALPSTYDFPALVTSLEQILKLGGYSIESIGGTDDELAQGSSELTAASGPVEIPIQLVVTTSYAGAQKLIEDLDRTIRPIQITMLELSGGEENMKVTISAKTYFQPGVKLEIPKEAVQ